MGLSGGAPGPAAPGSQQDRHGAGQRQEVHRGGGEQRLRAARLVPERSCAAAENRRQWPQNDEGARARNPRTGFVSYVPPGSVAKGEALAMTGGGGKTIACTICHGQGLHGIGEVPAIANRDPIYLYRQLNDMQAGMRNNPSMALMKAVVEKLTPDDLLSLAAYVGSLQP